MCHVLTVNNVESPEGMIPCYILPRNRSNLDLNLLRNRSSPILDNPQETKTFGTGAYLPYLNEVAACQQPHMLDTMIANHLTYPDLVALRDGFHKLDQEYREWLLQNELCAYAGALLSSTHAGDEDGLSILIPVLVPEAETQSVTITFRKRSDVVDSMSVLAGFIGW